MAPLPEAPRDLPNEILLSIVENLPLCDLKNLRLACKSLNAMCEPRLFRTIVLLPYMGCLQGFTAAMTSSISAARHVRKLVYDARWHDCVCDLRRQAMILSGIDPQDWNDTTPEPESPVALLNGVIQARFWNEQDMAVEVVLLDKIFAMLPNLDQLEVEEQRHGEFTSGCPAYLSQLRKIFQVEQCRGQPTATLCLGKSERLATKSILISLSISKCKVRELRARNLSWRILLEHDPARISTITKQLELYKMVMPRLRTLEITFSSHESEMDSGGLAAFGELLKTAVKLRHLTLTLSRHVDRYEVELFEEESYIASWLKDASGRPRTTTIFPRLKSLSLNSVLCCEKEFLTLLRLQENSLRRLRLSNISLVKDSESASYPCWVRVMRLIKDMKLQSVSFSEWLSNGGRQQWKISKTPTEAHCIKSRVEKWIRTRHEQIRCPLELVAVLPGKEDVTIPGDGQEEFKGDTSWAMVHDDQHEQDFLDEDLESMNSDSISDEGLADFYGSGIFPREPLPDFFELTDPNPFATWDRPRQF